MISDEDRIALLEIARSAITAAVAGHDGPEVALAGGLARPAAAFVTLSLEGELRGCVGHIERDEPLGHVVARCAKAAGLSDPRFVSVVAEEIALLDIEISILGPLEPAAGADDIEIGRHGLLVELGGRRGLLLPTVAAERNWDAETFIVHTFLKAGLPADARDRGARLWRFETEVLREGDT
jgi:AmmeMemoRadiSam system protein A